MSKNSINKILNILNNLILFVLNQNNSKKKDLLEIEGTPNIQK